MTAKPEPKPLLNQPRVESLVEALLNGACSDITVVTGARAQEVAAVLRGGRRNAGRVRVSMNSSIGSRPPSGGAM